jgi:hypothetical protein
MTAERIRQIVRILGLQSPYWRLFVKSSAHPPSTLAACFRIALRDPALGWHLALSYVDAGLPLPPEISESVIVRASHFLQDPYKRDVNVEVARGIALLGTGEQRDLLRGLLLCKASLEEIAQRSGIDVDVLRLFEGLFWNCQDRLDERLYLARISRQGVFAKPNAAEGGANPPSTGFWSGRLEEVLSEIAGHSDLTPGESRTLIGHEVLAFAAMELKHDQVFADRIVPALKIMARMKRTRTSENGPVHGPEAAQGIAMSYHGLSEQQEQYDLAVQYQQRLAAESKSAETPSSPKPDAPPSA